MKNIFICIAIILLFGFTVVAQACGSGGNPSSSPASATVTKSAVKLVFTTQPSGGIAGSVFDTQPVIVAEDTEGNIITDYSGHVVLSITPGTGANEARLLGGTTVEFRKGIVEFKSITIDKAGTGYTLTASSGNLSAVSEPFSIIPGKPAKLAFTVQPASGKVGVPLSPAPEVIAQDIYGNTVTDFEGTVTLSGIVTYPNFNNDQYGTQPKTVVVPVVFQGTTTVRAINGVARFPEVTASRAGEKYVLKAVSESLDAATGQYFQMFYGDPAKLEFSIQPEGAVAGMPFETQPKVVIMDRFGNVVTGAKKSYITVSITPGSGTPGAVLSGNNSVLTDSAFGGLAEFEDLSIDLVGTGYTLTAVLDNGVLTQTSRPFDTIAPKE